MNTDEHLKSALQAIARREVPEDTNLLPQIAAHFKQKETVPMKSKRKLIWTVLLVLLGLALVSGAAYALYNYFSGDAGMEAVSQAGMVNEVNATALPTILPSATPLPPAVPLGTAQTLRGVTLTLNWVYLDDMWQAIGFSVSELAEDQRLGIPQLGFGKIQPEQYRGAGMALSPSNTGLEGMYVVHQIVRDSATFMTADTLTDVSVEIPLLDGNGQVLDTFRFTAPQVLVHQTPYGGGNIYAVRANGLEMRLEWVALTPTETRAKLCYDQPAGASLKLEQAVLQSEQDAESLFDTPAIPVQQVIETTVEDSQRCAEVVFPPSARDARALRLVVDTLKDAGGTEVAGPWEFILSTLPQQTIIPGITPLGSQSIDNVKVTLLQAYADALRVAVVYRVEGAPEGQFASLELIDPEGKPFNTGGSITPDENDPGVFIASLTFTEPPAYKADSGVFSHREPVVDGRFVGKLKITINPWEPQGGQAFTFDLDLPAYPPLILTIGQSQSANGVQMVLEKLEVTPSYTQAYLCYDKPTAADWMLSYDKTILQIGRSQAQINNYALVLDQDYGIQNRPEWATLPGSPRCVIAGFAVGHHSQPETLTLTVGLEQSVPEVIPDDQLQAARQQLRQQGIEMDWVTFSGNGGGGAGPKITQKPDGMTDEEVLRRFYEALGYHFPGKWIFTLDIQP